MFLMDACWGGREVARCLKNIPQHQGHRFESQEEPVNIDRGLFYKRRFPRRHLRSLARVKSSLMSAKDQLYVTA